MSEALFTDTRVRRVALMQKESSFTAQLSSNSDNWPQEIIQEALKQHPYLGQFETMPVMIKVNGERGYGLGYVLVSTRSSARTDASRVQEGVKEIKVPIIIQDNELAPFDLFTGADGKVIPLNETRLREAIYRPNLLDTMGIKPRSAFISDQLYPPEVGHGASVHKLGSGSLLSQILPTITSGQLKKFASALSDRQLLHDLVTNKITAPFISALTTCKPTSTSDVIKVASRMIQPDIAQIRRVRGRYLLKTADSQLFNPSEVEADRPTMEDLVGSDAIQKADQTGSVTVSANPVVREVVEDEQIGPITEFGEYRVQDTMGHEHMGWVFPRVIDLTGVSLPMTLFLNGSISAIQEKIVGSFVGKGTNVIRATPEGQGFFYRITATGGVVAYEPMECSGGFIDETGKAYNCDNLEGEQFIVRPVPGAITSAHMGGREYAVPGDVRWAPLGEKVIALNSDPVAFVKQGALKRADSTVRVHWNGSTYSVYGGAGISKLAVDLRHNLDRDDAMFLLASVGVHPELADSQIIKAASRGRSDAIEGCRSIVLIGDRIRAAREKVASQYGSLPRTPSMEETVKLAATLDDGATVDKVLSLGFLNPENVDLFIGHIPNIEKAMNRVGELLLASRLGLPDVSNFACKSAMERLDEVITGLKSLMHRKFNVS